MNILAELRVRFRQALADLTDDPTDLLEMIRPAQDVRFGDYQANFAMSLAKRLGKSPRDVAVAVVERLQVAELCDPPTVAGPGFINLRFKDQWISEQMALAVENDRHGVPLTSTPRTYVIDYSSPNVAKPMHVGHIRSTVIGGALDRTLRFLGHRVISDNHLGDWGTQFGMIIYGYKHFRNDEAFRQQPVAELARLYKLVHQLVSYSEDCASLPRVEQEVLERAAAVDRQLAQPSTNDKAQQKAAEKTIRKLEAQFNEAKQKLSELDDKIRAVDEFSSLFEMWREHSNIASAVLEETAKLHAGDPENLKLWSEFLPNCRDEIQRVYKRLDVHFDQELGESFYRDKLGTVVDDFVRLGAATQSEGATCVFLSGFDSPMIIRKKDGAYLYATTDLATIQYRMKTWKPDAILYVVDYRQSEHFEKLFAAAKTWGFDSVDLCHVSFGTVLGNDGRPYKTRSGETVGLEGLLDEAVSRAYSIVSQNDDAKKVGPELSEAERRNIAEVVGIAALKYADLSQNRTSDYEFSYDKMLAMRGNTATYMQYSFARVNGIFQKGNVDLTELRRQARMLRVTGPEERAVAMAVLRFAEALDEVLIDYRPNLLTTYLFELTEKFFSFYERCPVLTADSDELRNSRLLICDLFARVIRQGLHVLGIQVVERM